MINSFRYFLCAASVKSITMAYRLTCVLLMILCFDRSLSAMVAQDKVSEIIQQAEKHIFGMSEGDPRQLDGIQDGQITQMVEPLSLQLSVLQVTDSLTREMSLPKWQAMLRALGGDKEILKRFAQLRSGFSNLEKQVGQSGDHWGMYEQFNHLSELKTSTPWARLWPRLQTLVETVSNLYDWFDRYQRNAAVVNERTLRDYADTVHGQDGLTTVKAIESIHKPACPNEMGDGDYDGEDFPRQKNESTICSGGAFEVLRTALLQVH